jgi:hypothetical protein
MLVLNFCKTLRFTVIRSYSWAMRTTYSRAMKSRTPRSGSLRKFALQFGHCLSLSSINVHVSTNLQGQAELHLTIHDTRTPSYVPGLKSRLHTVWCYHQLYSVVLTRVTPMASVSASGCEFTASAANLLSFSCWHPFFSQRARLFLGILC